MYRRPAAVIPCAVLVYLSLAPAGHFLARKGLEDHEPQDQDNEPAASHKHKNEKCQGHEHAKHDLGHHQQAQKARRSPSLNNRLKARYRTTRRMAIALTRRLLTLNKKRRINRVEVLHGGRRRG